MGQPPVIRYAECPKQLPRPAELGGRKNLHDKLRGRPDTSGQTPVHGRRRPSDALRSSPARLGPTVGPGGHNNFNNPNLHLEPLGHKHFPPTNTRDLWRRQLQKVFGPRTPDKGHQLQCHFSPHGHATPWVSNNKCRNISKPPDVYPEGPIGPHLGRSDTAATPAGGSGRYTGVSWYAK